MMREFFLVAASQRASGELLTLGVAKFLGGPWVLSSNCRWWVRPLRSPIFGQPMRSQLLGQVSVAQGG